MANNKIDEQQTFIDALTKRIDDVCHHEGLCRKQNRELWQENETLRNELKHLHEKTNHQ